ncbi:flippase [Clostridium sp.]|uniref:flippase n=1 Tax=Clostridium sp. TaxID=1506 RepID=UPI0025E0E393|nr:flippase [uncultured Clostridium sp.]
MTKSIKINFIYNLIFQIVTLCLPLITVPYTSRVLGREGVGLYSYTLSITQYFIIIGTLGMSLYGNRAIAYVRDNKKELSKTFWAILVLRILTTTISLIMYLSIFCLNNENKIMYLIQALNILAATIDISWLYMGLEDFRKTVTRGLVVKILCVLSIFIFVREQSDLWIYTLINALMLVLGNGFMWLYLPKAVDKTKITFKDMKIHLIPTLQMFIPQIAIQVYAVLDKTMLGILATKGDVGIYEQSQKIVKIVGGLVTSLGVVMLPRMSNTFANGDKKKMNEYLNKSLIFVSYMSIPMFIGLAAISNEFVPWFFGEDFLQVRYIMMILTPILFFIAINNVLGVQYLLPTNRTKEYTIAVSTGAITNVVFNFLLIPKYKVIGACIATLLAELIVPVVELIILRKNINIKYIFKNIYKYFFAGAIMFIIVRFIGKFMGVSILTTMIQAFSGGCIYLATLLIFKDEFTKVIIGNIFSTIKIARE